MERVRTQLSRLTQSAEPKSDLERTRQTLIEILGTRAKPVFRDDANVRAFMKKLDEQGLRLNKGKKQSDKLWIKKLFSEWSGSREPHRNFSLGERSAKKSSRPRRRDGSKRAGSPAFFKDDLVRLQVIFAENDLFASMTNDSIAEFMDFVADQGAHFSDEDRLRRLFVAFVDERTAQETPVHGKSSIVSPVRTRQIEGRQNERIFSQAILKTDNHRLRYLLNEAENPTRLAQFPGEKIDVYALEAGAKIYLRRISRPLPEPSESSDQSILNPSNQFLEEVLFSAFPTLRSGVSDAIQIAGRNALTAAISLLTSEKSFVQTDSLKRMIRVLCEWANGGLVSLRDGCGQTPLTTAVAQGDAEIVRFLLDFGADANQATKEGRSPLAIALSDANQQLARLLLNSGANPFDVEPNGLCTLELAQLRGGDFADELMSMLLDALPAASADLCMTINDERKRSGTQANSERLIKALQFIKTAIVEDTARRTLTTILMVAVKELNPVDLLFFADQADLADKKTRQTAFDRSVDEIVRYFEQLFAGENANEIGLAHWTALQRSTEILTEIDPHNLSHGKQVSLNRIDKKLLSVAIDHSNAIFMSPLVEAINMSFATDNTRLHHTNNVIERATDHAKEDFVTAQWRRVFPALAKMTSIALDNGSIASKAATTNLIELWNFILDQGDFEKISATIDVVYPTHSPKYSFFMDKIATPLMAWRFRLCETLSDKGSPVNEVGSVYISALTSSRTRSYKSDAYIVRMVREAAFVHLLRMERPQILWTLNHLTFDERLFLLLALPFRMSEDDLFSEKDPGMSQIAVGKALKRRLRDDLRPPKRAADFGDYLNLVVPIFKDFLNQKGVFHGAPSIEFKNLLGKTLEEIKKTPVFKQFMDEFTPDEISDFAILNKRVISFLPLFSSSTEGELGGGSDEELSLL